MEPNTVIRLASKVLGRSSAEELYLRTGYNRTKPSDFTATLTERCNYRCSYCCHWRQEAYTEEMSLDEWKTALLSIRDFVGGFAVQFLGGEPMLVPWFFQLATFCFQSRIDWGVITNGSSLSADRVRSLVLANPLNIDISLDSLQAQVHDHVRGVPGSTTHVSDGIKRLVEARQQGGRKFPIRIKPTVTRHNIGCLNEIVDWAETMPSVLVDFSPVRLPRRDEVAAIYPRSGRELDRLTLEIERLIRRKASGAPVETSNAKLRAMIPHFQDAPATHGVASCRVGLRSINIRPNGDVDHCHIFNKIGSLRRSTMREIWMNWNRREIVERTVACKLFTSTCSMSCHSHRSLSQDISRGLKIIRAASRY